MVMDIMIFRGWGDVRTFLTINLFHADDHVMILMIRSTSRRHGKDVIKIHRDLPKDASIGRSLSIHRDVSLKTFT